MFYATHHGGAGPLRRTPPYPRRAAGKVGLTMTGGGVGLSRWRIVRLLP